MSSCSLCVCVRSPGPGGPHIFRPPANAADPDAGCKLQAARLEAARLQGCRRQVGKAKACRVASCRLQGCRLQGCKLRGCKLQGCRLQAACSLQPVAYQFVRPLPGPGGQIIRKINNLTLCVAYQFVRPLPGPGVSDHSNNHQSDPMMRPFSYCLPVRTSPARPKGSDHSNNQIN